MTKEQKIKAFKRRGYKVCFNFTTTGQTTVCVKMPWGSWRFYNSVNHAYKNRPWKYID